MSQLKSIVIRGAGSALASLFMGSVALAQNIFGGGPGSPPLPTTPTAVTRSKFSSVETGIQTIFNVIIGASLAIFAVLLLIGGIQYLTAAGNEEATAKSKKLLVDSIIGLVIVLGAWAIGQYVISSVTRF